ncbi:phage tail tape measure protein [Ornithinibacillus sp. 4-3]|uniref:Phage tail tape measure protein n=1 Tax=Ornithinibacillus sp. 4-3 TaxID=3231488 RepID=A0AB39HKG5_9BACI
MSGKNLKVNLVANTSQFKSAMTQSSNQIKLLNSEFKKAAAETDKYGNKLDATGAKKRQLNGIIDQYKVKIQAITTEQRRWTSELKKGNITEQEHAQKQQELARRLNNTQAEMKRYEGQLKRLNAEGKKVTRTYADFNKQFRNVGMTIRNTSAQVGIAAGIGFYAMKRAIGDVLTEAMNFESGMSRVKAVSGATAEEMAAMKDQALELNKTTVFTAEQAAAGMEKLALSGWKAEAIMKAMPGMLSLAAAGSLELATAADITSDTMQAFNLSADKATHSADVFAYAQANANTNVEQMGEAMKYLAPTANSLGWSLEESAAVIMKLADNGLKGSMATQAFGSSLVRLSAPTPKASKLIKKLGMEFFDAEGKMKTMPEVIAEMEKGLSGMSEEQKAATMDVLVGKNAFKQWQILLKESSGTLSETTDELRNADGAAKDMADTMLDNAQGALVRMQSALSALKIELGEKLLPIFANAAEFVMDLANNLSEMDDATIQSVAETALLVTAVLGVTTAVAGLVTAFGALMAFAGPIGVAITAGTLILGTLAAAIYKNKVETERLAEEQEKARTEALRYGDGLSEGTKKGVKGYTDLYEGAKLKMLELRTMSEDEAKKTSAEVVKAFSEMADKVIAELETQREKLTNAVNEVYAIAGDAGKEAANEYTNKAIEHFDEDIANYKRALDVVKKAHDEYSSDLSKMPYEFAHEYQEALKVLEGGSREFARTQDELFNIQKNISGKQGNLVAQEASQWSKKMNDTYQASLKAANDWYVEKQATFEQAVAQGVYTQEEYEQLMIGVQSRTNEMMAMAAKEYEETNQILFDNLDKRGDIIDLKTGEIFERQEKNYVDAEGMVKKSLETQEDYLARWMESNMEHLEGNAEFAQHTQDIYLRDLQAFLVACGMTAEEAEAMSIEIASTVLEGLEEGDERAFEAGKNKGEAHIDGIESTKTEVANAGGEITDVADHSFHQKKDSAHKAGKDKGEAHKKGIESTKSENDRAADGVSKSTTDNLAKTSDGGGGKKAVYDFIAGMRGQQSNAYAQARSTAQRGEKGLKSVKTKSAGDGFVSGFRGSINGGNRSIWSAAWSLGKSALNALKQSIKSRSPSRETGKEGINFVDGFAINISSNKKKAINSAKVLGKESVQALNSELTNYKNAMNALPMALEKNKEVLKVEHEVKNSGLEDQLNALENVMKKLVDVMNSNSEDKGDINVSMNIVVRGQNDIDKIDTMLSNLGNRRKAAFGGAT